MKRKVTICIIAIMSLAIAFTSFWYIALLNSVIIALYIVNIKTSVYDSKIMNLLHKRNNIVKINTLVIGDTCNEHFLSQYKNGNTLCIQHYNRSIEASLQIFMHIESLLEEKGRLIILNDSKIKQEGFSIYDIPYLNKITQKELGIEQLIEKAKNPLFS